MSWQKHAIIVASNDSLTFCRLCDWWTLQLISSAFFMRCLSTDSSKPPCWCWVMLSDNCGPVPARAWLRSFQFDDHVNTLRKQQKMAARNCTCSKQNRRKMRTMKIRACSFMGVCFCNTEGSAANCQRTAIRLSIRPENTNTVIVTRIFIQTKDV